MYYVKKSEAFEALAEIGVTGLAGTLEVAIHDSQATVVFGPTTAGITELVVDGQPTGWYRADLVAPAVLGQYGLVYSLDGSFDPDTNTTDELTVVASLAVAPLPPLDTGEEVPRGPCSAWTTGEDVAECCDVEIGSDFPVFDDAIVAASQVLWEFSARQFSGSCLRTVYPRGRCSSCCYQTLSRGYVVFQDDCNCSPCNCHGDTVLLASYPVTEIVEVVIGGAAFDPDSYELRNWRYLVRTDGFEWPLGEWSIEYVYGQNPPAIGQMAARELACEVYRSCTASMEECALPSGVTSIQRQGVTIDRNAFATWGRVEGSWRTGLPLVDLFLNAYNPAGIRRRPIFVAPGNRSYPRSAGV